ncbi:MAG: hypothetical protein K2P44_00995 [Lachnospiraceae bacterium]|nr:hypothetical protein [Lachnospiraceae bacterium]
MEGKMKKIAFYEPWFFLLFGIFHLHRIWGMIDRKSYADFWIGILKSRNVFYYVLMIILAMFCLLGIISFFKNIHHNYWWRWIYVAGGSYLLFDLFAIYTRLKFWNELLLWMYDTTSPYWNTIWLMFILLGGFVFCLGIKLLIDYQSKK